MPTMPTPTLDPLAQLRDIHLPPTIDWWPIAPGWWLLGLLVSMVVLGCYLGVRRYRRRRAYRRSALMALKQLESSCDDDLSYIQGINRLLKQTALSIDSRQDVSRLHGQQWLVYLQQGRNDKPFTEGVGRVLAYGPYQAITEPLDRQALQALATRWIKEQKPC